MNVNYPDPYDPQYVRSLTQTIKDLESQLDKAVKRIEDLERDRWPLR